MCAFIVTKIALRQTTIIYTTRRSWRENVKTKEGKQQNKTTTSMSKSTIPINVLCILNGKPNANIARKRKDKKNNENYTIKANVWEKNCRGNFDRLK